MNAVACSQLAFQMLTLLQKAYCSVHKCKSCIQESLGAFWNTVLNYDNDATEFEIHIYHHQLQNIPIRQFQNPLNVFRSTWQVCNLARCPFWLPKSGVSACGVLSCKISMNTENASNMKIPRDSFSPESTGTAKVRADKHAKVAVGIIIFRK